MNGTTSVTTYNCSILFLFYQKITIFKLMNLHIHEHKPIFCEMDFPIIIIRVNPFPISGASAVILFSFSMKFLLANRKAPHMRWYSWGYTQCICPRMDSRLHTKSEKNSGKLGVHTNWHVFYLLQDIAILH